MELFMPIYNIYQYFSSNIIEVLEKYFGREAKPSEYISLEEIRLRAARTVNIKIF